MLPEVDFIYESEPGWGIGGTIMGVTIRGHVEDDVAIPLAWDQLADYGVDGSIDRPRRLWVRKIPVRDEYGDHGGMAYHYQPMPGPGASAMTVVELARARPEKCALCPWDSAVGYHASRFADPKPPSVDYFGKPYVYLCRSHSREHEAAEREARRPAAAETTP